ncbi:MAG: mandelate racemase/muconate lactonizing enzyme family protein, partial [Candidatus Hodarchaeota archaeon]
YTDDGIIGIGPGDGRLPPPAIDRLKSFLVNSDPFYVTRFFEEHMGVRGGARMSLGGVDTALWDIVGKALGTPVFKLLGAYRDRVPVYVATCQLHSPGEHAEEAVRYREDGVRAIKLRLHRQDHKDDLEVVKTVRDAVGDDMIIMVDANQNNHSPGYNYWSRRTAMWMAKKLDALEVYYLEDPLPLSDVEGLKQLADAVDMYISGGEQAQDVTQFASLLFRGALDIVETDITMGARIGLTGSKKVAHIAESVGRMVIPHVFISGVYGLHLAATLQVAATLSERVCPYVEYVLEPPALTVESLQGLLQTPIVLDGDGCVQVPQLPGIGIEINEEFVKKYE